MPDKPTAEEAGWADEDVAQRAIVLQVLRDDHALCWTREQLQKEIYDIEPEDIARAIQRLREEGVVITKDNMVRASRCARWLDDLGMVSI
jgi:hypothetical protein